MKISILLTLIYGLLLSTGYGPPADQQKHNAWPVIDTVLVVEDLENPVHITHAPDGSGRLFVVEQPGRVKILLNGSLQGTFLDISGRVRSSGNEEGLLSLAFPPGYGPTHAYFYVYYTASPGVVSMLARYSVSGGNPDDAADLVQEVLLRVRKGLSSYTPGSFDGWLWRITRNAFLDGVRKKKRRPTK